MSKRLDKKKKKLIKIVADNHEIRDYFKQGNQEEDMLVMKEQKLEDKIVEEVKKEKEEAPVIDVAKEKEEVPVIDVVEEKEEAPVIDVAEEKEEAPAIDVAEEKEEVPVIDVAEEKEEAPVIDVAEEKEEAPVIDVTVEEEDIKQKIYFQHNEIEVSSDDIIDRIKSDLALNGKNLDEMEELDIYVQPENCVAYYVVDKDYQGEIRLN